MKHSDVRSCSETQTDLHEEEIKRVWRVAFAPLALIIDPHPDSGRGAPVRSGIINSSPLHE